MEWTAGLYEYKLFSTFIEKTIEIDISGIEYEIKVVNYLFSSNSKNKQQPSWHISPT